MTDIESKIAQEAERTTGNSLTVKCTPNKDGCSRFRVAVGLNSDGELPPLGHWAFFHTYAADEDIGADGHPRPDGFLPRLAELPRRMFAGSQTDFHHPLQMDVEAGLRMRIAEVSAKPGRNGIMMFVKVARQIEQDGRCCIDEKQTLVYRTPSTGAEMTLPEPVQDDSSGGDMWTPGPVNLFRFSAATSNAHRIHYDAIYTREVEGYPALVVHGPFIAAKLAARAAQEGQLANLSYRATAPAFVGQPIQIMRQDDEGFAAFRCDQVQIAMMKVAYR